MSEAFDPYHLWLGIPPDEQPPNCYRLLGLPLFEESPEAIEHAADQRMAHLKSLAAGKHSHESQRLLNEVAAARVRLLDPHKKAFYDQRLRQELDAKRAAVPPPAAPPEGEPQPAPLGPALPATKTFQAAVQVSAPSMAALGQLGEYQLLEKLGQGGMGAVYKALHTKLKRVVAVKVLLKDRVRDEHSIARFEREMEAVGAVDHPNIVRAMDAREIEGTRFLVMEYVDGLDLNALGRACHPLSIADACEIVRQAALALEEVHRHGLVHRDVKPSNLMVALGGTVKLLDLGLARFQFSEDADDEVTGTGIALGTVDYMAPEQVADSRSVDIRADIYSLGCTLYKLLTGQTPFSGPKYKTAAEKMTGHLHDAPPPVRRLRSDVPKELVHLLDRMLAKEPRQRPMRPAEVADALGPLAAGSDLGALVARGRGQAAAPAEGGQAMEGTQDRSPSSATRLFQRIVGASPAAPAGTVPHRRGPPAAVAVAAAVAAAALLAVAAWAVFWRGGSGDAVLVLDWPDEHRRGAAVSIDGAAVEFPPDGPLEHRCKPGPHKINGTRPGLRLREQVVEVQAGQRRQVGAQWLPVPNLIVEWPVAERVGGALELDGKPQDLEKLAARSVSGRLELTAPPGRHTVSMRRLGHGPFEQAVEVAEGKEALVRPVWKELSVIGEPKPPAPEPPAVAKDPPKPEPPPSKPPEVAVKSAQPKDDREAKRQLLLDSRWAEAVAPAEARAAVWDFRGAAVELNKVRFEEPELTARLAQRRQELKRMHDLKEKLLGAINQASAPLKKSDMGIKGLGGDVTKADHEGFTATLLGGKTETVLWSSIGPSGLAKLFAPKQFDRLLAPATADDWLAASLVALALGSGSEAERCLAQARSLGINIDPYLASLAAAAFADANALLDKKQYSAAETALAAIEAKYASTPWFTSHKPAHSAARAAAKTGIHETEAEKLYAEAAELFNQKEFFDLKPIVEKLKTDCASTAPVTDATRKPSLADFEKATSSVGKVLRVRLDGKGEFKSIQAAIDAAPPQSVIQIEDNGPYNEKVVIPEGRAGLTVRGRKGCWPVLASSGARLPIETLVTIQAERTSLQRLVLVHDSPFTATACCVFNAGYPDLLLRFVLVYMRGPEGLQLRRWGDPPPCRIEGSVILANAILEVRLTTAHTLWLGERFANSGLGTCYIRFCTVNASFDAGRDWVLTDSIVRLVNTRGPAKDITYCNVLGGLPSRGTAIVGDHCFTQDPVFRDAPNLDYRLKPGSPCIGKASDGGDIGCRYTPEMLELCKQALDLRRRGILKF